MKIKVLLLFVFIAYRHSVFAQTLFTYGTHTVSKNEFLKAFNKNTDTTGNKEEKLKEYLGLYINFRLKLQAAYDEGADKNDNLKLDAGNFKAQLAENYINRQANFNSLMHEAFVRSQKDILTQQIFAGFTGSDTTNAYTQISKAYSDLKAGKIFNEIAATYSNGSNTKLVRQNIGYITVFTLPYSIENIVYNLKPGGFSAVYKSPSGYHIFKNAEERPAAGRKLIQQLLLPTPAFFTNEQVNAVAGKADSVYNLLKTGTPFSSMLAYYGKEDTNVEDSGVIEIKVGEYDAAFEQQVFRLKNNGDISKPFKTSYGYNIIRLVESIPVLNNENDEALASWLQTQIKNDGRLDAIKKQLTETWLAETGFKEAAYNRSDLWHYTDSALQSGNNLPEVYKTIKPATVLFQFAKEKITVKDWMDYLEKTANGNYKQEHDYVGDMHNYIRFACNNYYRQHIEDFDKDAQEQLKEFNDANLMFYVMDEHVWSKAADDSAGLRNYFQLHKQNYLWKKSVSAIVVSATDSATANSVAAKIKSEPQLWRSVASGYNNVYADSGRFEVSELPVKQPIQMQEGFITKPETNEAGDAYVFIYIEKVYPGNEQKNFEEAKGAVINDYQQQLENEFIAALREKYPVKINQATLAPLH